MLFDSEKYNVTNEFNRVILECRDEGSAQHYSTLLNQAYNKEVKSEDDVVNAKKLLVVFQTQLEAVDALIESLDGQLSQVENLIVSAELNDLKESTVALDGEIKEIFDAEELIPNEQVAAIHKQLTTIRNRIVSAS